MHNVTAPQISWSSVDLSGVSFAIDQLKTQQYQNSTLRNISFDSTRGTFVARDNTELDCSFTNPDLDKIEISDSQGRLRLQEGIVKQLVLVNARAELLGNCKLSELRVTTSTLTHTEGLLDARCIDVRDCPKIAFESLTCERFSISKSNLTLVQLPIPPKRTLGSDEVSARELCPLSVVDSVIAMPAYQAVPRVLDHDTLRVSSIRNCRLAGIPIEIKVADPGFWPGCEGLLFYVQKREERNNKSAAQPDEIVKGRLLIADADQFRMKKEYAKVVLKRAAEMFKSWMRFWLDECEEELKKRRKETAQN